MIKVDNVDIVGFKHAIRGMRNPLNSWDKSDSSYIFEDGYGASYYEDEDNELAFDYDYVIGPADMDLMRRLANAGTDHRKYLRMIVVWMDILAPLYWWKEFDTYKVGTVANSCSTMHKIAEKEFTLDDFSREHLFTIDDVVEKGYVPDSRVFTAINVYGEKCFYSPSNFIDMTCQILNKYRDLFNKTKDERYWWQMIQLLPSSYNQKRTVMMNYEVLAHMYFSRKDHKLDEWRDFCEIIEQLPYFRAIFSLEKDKNQMS